MKAAQRQALRQNLAHDGGQPIGAVASSYAIILGDQTRDRHRANLLSRGSTACQIAPPTFSKYTSCRPDRVQSVGPEIGGAVVDGSIEPEFIFHEAHFSSPPAMPTALARHLRQLAHQRSDPLRLPPRPPRFRRVGFADDAQAGISRNPGMPSTPAAVVTGGPPGSSLCRAAPSESACVRHPV